MIYRIDDLESLSETLRACLKDAGVKNTRHILEKCATAKGRAALSRESGIAEAHILHCVHVADLLRVKGVGDAFVMLLLAADVTSVEALKDADAVALTPRLVAAKARVKRAHRSPTVRDVTRWIEDAASLTPVFS